MKFIKKLWWCKIWHWHKWTSAVQQGEKPTEEQIKGSLIGFLEYSTMYCERCGEISNYSKELLCKYKDSE